MIISSPFLRVKDSQEYKLLKYRYELLLKSGDKINDEKYFFDRTLGYTTSEAGVLECVLSINKELKMAYNLKEDYRVFNDVKENEYNEEEYLTDVLKEKIIM